MPGRRGSARDRRGVVGPIRCRRDGSPGTTVQFQRLERRFRPSSITVPSRIEPPAASMTTFRRARRAARSAAVRFSDAVSSSPPDVGRRDGCDGAGLDGGSDDAAAGSRKPRSHSGHSAACPRRFASTAMVAAQDGQATESSRSGTGDDGGDCRLMALLGRVGGGESCGPEPGRSAWERAGLPMRNPSRANPAAPRGAAARAPAP